MNRNARLVFQLLSLPVVLAITEVRLLGTIGGVAFLLLAFTDMEPVRVLFYAAVAFAAFMLAAAFRHLGSGLLANAIIIAAVVAAWKSEPVLDRVIPSAERVRVSSQIPVTMMQTRVGDTIQVTITNDSPDWLEMAGIACQGFYADGSPVEHEWTRSVSYGHWVAPGEAIKDKLARKFYPDERDRFDTGATRCRVAFATPRGRIARGDITPAAHRREYRSRLASASCGVDRKRTPCPRHGGAMTERRI